MTINMSFEIPGMTFPKLAAALLLLLLLAGTADVHGVTYQVEPEVEIVDQALDFHATCVSANAGMSCVSNADGTLLQPYFLPTTKTSCSSVVVKAPIFENIGYWKCIVVNTGLATPSNPERVVIFGNDTVDGSSPLLRPYTSSFSALGKPFAGLGERFEAIGARLQGLGLGPLPPSAISVEATFGNLTDTKLQATVNDSVNLNCTSDSATLPQYIWEYRNATNGLWRVFSHAQNVTVKGVFGELWCSVWDKFGPVRSKSTLTIERDETVNGSELPSPYTSSFSVIGGTPLTVNAHFGDLPDTDLKVTVNDTVIMNCTSDSSTSPQYIWEYRNASNGLWRVFSHAQNLTVKGVFGELWCSAWDTVGPVRSKSTLTIENLADSAAVGDANTLSEMSSYLTNLFVFGPPANVEAHTASGEDEIAATILQPVQLYCTSDAAMPSRYIWEHRNPITGIWRVFHHGNNLIVRGVFGEFKCTAWNSFGPVRSTNSITISPLPVGPAEPSLAVQSPFLSSFIDVSPDPVISVSASFGVEGLTERPATSNDTVQLYCNSNSTSQSRYIWFYRNNATGALRVVNTAQNISTNGLYGEFWCSVWNRFGSTASETTLQILHAPERVDIISGSGNPPIIQTHKGEFVDLSCNTDAYPAASYRWERRDIGKAWKVYAFDEDILVASKKAGEFVCVANNTLGEIRSTEVIIVVEPPIAEKALLSSDNMNNEGSTGGMDASIAIVGGGLVAAVLIMLVLIGATFNRYRRRGTYREMKKESRYSTDVHSAGERQALVSAAQC